MKQYSFSLKSLEDFAPCLAQFKANCPVNPSAILVTIFCGWSKETQVLDLLAKLREALPCANIVGSSTAGEILDGQLSEGTTLLNFMVFKESKVVVKSLHFSEVNSALPLPPYHKEDLKGLGILLATNDSRTYNFITKLNTLDRELPIFGGVAACQPEQDPYVLTQDQILKDGLVLIAFLSPSLHLHITTSHGWHPLGPWFRITAMQNDNVITELNHKPASLTYKKYLAIQPEEIEKGNFLFPLFLERDGQNMLRLPAHATATGALEISAECKVGEKVRLAYGDPSSIIDASSDRHNSLLEFKPEAILLFNCVSHRFFLRDSANQELRFFQDIAPCAGYYTHGEIGRTRDEDLYLLNMTLVSVGFREKDLDEPLKNFCVLPATKKLSGTLKLVHHLTHFISVTSSELEEANEQLTELAATDRLTGLYNRGEIEAILKKDLSSQNYEHLSAIMIDLDNFKKINDTFGHDVGDHVLKGVGNVLQKGIRKTDAAGRWGGEEFFIILPGAPLNVALKIAERIRTNISEACILPDGQKVTASVGVAEYQSEGSYHNFYQNLDKALYQAKHCGKNMCCTLET